MAQPPWPVPRASRAMGAENRTGRVAGPGWSLPGLHTVSALTCWCVEGAQSTLGPPQVRAATGGPPSALSPQKLAGWSTRSGVPIPGSSWNPKMTQWECWAQVRDRDEPQPPPILVSCLWLNTLHGIDCPLSSGPVCQAVLGSRQVRDPRCKWDPAQPCELKTDANSRNEGSSLLEINLCCMCLSWTPPSFSINYLWPTEPRTTASAPLGWDQCPDLPSPIPPSH